MAIKRIFKTDNIFDSAGKHSGHFTWEESKPNRYGAVIQSGGTFTGYLGDKGAFKKYASGGWGGGMNPPQWAKAKAAAALKMAKRSNPAPKSNPSDSALAGARILGVTRNRAGKVTALKLQLKAGAGRGRGAHRNPIVRASDVGPYAYQTKTSLSGGWRTIGRAKTIKAATTQARANAKYDRAPARVMHYANGTVYGMWDSSGKKIG